MNLVENFNYFIYRFKYRHGQRLSLKSPVDVSLELSSSCNQFCVYCYHADIENLPFTKGIMKYEVGEKIIKEAAALHVNSLKFNWKGESTINPHFSKLTKLAKDLAHGSIFIDRLTNSNFKFRTDREEIFEGLCNQTKVKVSYDSFRKEVFETQRAGGDHAITSRNIDKFYNYPLRKNTQLVIQAVRTRLNKDEDLEAEVKRRWPDAEISIRDMVGGRVEKDLGSLEHRSRDHSERQSCIQAHVRIIFNWEGKAFPCCPDIGEKLCLGDIRTQSLAEIFNGERARFLRRQLKSKEAFKTNPCLGCSSFETYKGFKPVWNS
jgi:radical SAM protein with 4Fe4S-binding SPASM domain